LEVEARIQFDPTDGLKLERRARNSVKKQRLVSELQIGAKEWQTACCTIMLSWKKFPGEAWRAPSPSIRGA
jgi:hypothetical protein